MTKVVHFARKGSRRTVCGIKTKKTMRDTYLAERVTCKRCLKSVALRG